MKVEIVKTFQLAVDGGNRVITVEAGSVVEDEEIAGVAVRGGYGRELVEKPDEPAPPSHSMRSLGEAPFNKGRGRR